MIRRKYVFWTIGAAACAAAILLAVSPFILSGYNAASSRSGVNGTAKVEGARQADMRGMIEIPEGETDIGANTGLARERPVFHARVARFYLDSIPVTVAAFAAFAERSGYVTENERVGNGAVMEFGSGQWTLVPGATWRKPLGPDGPDAVEDHPVTQISWNDAVAYCRSQGKRLPTEVEWEYAARFGQPADAFYPMTGEIKENGKYRANIWTGIFPVLNTNEDGYRYTSPVRSFPATSLGLYDMAGNVWEWTQDWYLPYGRDHKNFQPDAGSKKVQRGGSFLCDPNFCHGFRVSAREAATPESAFMHVGFRCAADAPRPSIKTSQE
jgi:sulfatase modifying factor 1